MAFQSFHLLIPYKSGEHKDSICRTQPGTEKALKKTRCMKSKVHYFSIWKFLGRITVSLHLSRKIFWKVPWPDRAAESGVTWDSTLRSFPTTVLSGLKCAKDTGAQPCHHRRQSHSLSHFAPVDGPSQWLCWSRPSPNNNLFTSHLEGKLSQKNWVQLSKSRYTCYCI